MNKRWVLDILPGCSKNARISTMEAFLNDIKILDLEASIIDKILHNERSKRIVMEELKKIRNLFTDSNEQIEIYTDGSLITNSSTMSRPIMGTGWTILDSKNQPLIEARRRIFNWASSTRSELAAIFHCLLALPANRKVIIYSDSQAAINCIQHTRKKIDRKKNMARV